MAEPSADDLKALAEMRLRDAEVLLKADRYAGAYYLAGYAVECGLKAIIARSFRQSVIPDRGFVQKVYSHDLNALVGLANLSAQLDAAKRGSAGFQANWAIASNWSEASRYEIIQPFIAELMVNAVGASPDGIVPWLKELW